MNLAETELPTETVQTLRRFNIRDVETFLSMIVTPTGLMALSELLKVPLSSVQQMGSELWQRYPNLIVEPAIVRFPHSMGYRPPPPDWLDRSVDPVDRILADHRKNPDTVLELRTDLSDADLMRLAESGAFGEVEELVVRGSQNTDWTSGRFLTFAVRLPKLSRLSLSGSREISGLGLWAVAERLTALTALNLSFCERVTDAGVQAVAEHLTDLESLNLMFCDKVTDAGVQAVAQRLTNLTTLNFSFCDKVTDTGVQAVAQRLTNLTTLNLAYCKQVTDVGVRAISDQLTKLTTLDLVYCDKVTDVGVRAIAQRLATLVQLSLSGCSRVTTLPEAIGQLRALEELYLSGTRLATLPASLRDLPRLRILDVRDVLSLKFPKELPQNPSNPRAILDYHVRTSTEGKRALNEAKLILVGNEAVGKTSLVNFLVQGKPASDTAKTTGVAIEEEVDVTSWNSDEALVEVTRWKVDRATAGSAPLRLNVWDFGGQQVLYETHQFFLTSRSLYLIVLEARRENANEQEGNLYLWLRSIRARTIEAVPVIVVINKSEPPHDLRLDEARLIREIPNIRGFVRTSCRDPKGHQHGGRGISELRKAIVEVIRTNLPHVHDLMPLSYFNIKEELAKTARRAFFLNTETYRKKCRAQKVTDPLEQENLLELLHRIGVVVKYDDTTLLDPNWLTTAVYRVLTHSAVVMAGGEFSLNDLGTLLQGLPPKDYPSDRWPFIAAMMQRFGLSFPLQGVSDRYLVPNQLPVEEPATPGWDSPDLLRFRYDYQDTPTRGLLPRFVVLAHRHLTRPRMAWLNGVVLAIQGCETLVKMDPHKRRLSITVRGPSEKRRAALAVVREHLAAVHESNKLVPGKDVFAKIPMLIPDQSDAAFDFDFLEALERDGVMQVPYPNTGVRFSVRELLAGVGPEPTVIRDPAEVRARATGGEIYNFHGSVLDVSSGEISVNVGGGNITGSTIGDPTQAIAEKIILSVRQQLAPTASGTEELRAVLAAAMEQLAKEQIDDEDRMEAKETVEKIEKELTKPDSNMERVSRWLESISQVSSVVGRVIRDAQVISKFFA